MNDLQRKINAICNKVASDAAERFLAAKAASRRSLVQKAAAPNFGSFGFATPGTKQIVKSHADRIERSVKAGPAASSATTVLDAIRENSAERLADFKRRQGGNAPGEVSSTRFNGEQSSNRSGDQVDGRPRSGHSNIERHVRETLGANADTARDGLRGR